MLTGAGEGDALIGGVAAFRIAAFKAREDAVYASRRPRTRAMLDAAPSAWLSGVPMHWMLDWPMPFPLLVEKAWKAHLRDCDGHELNDFCLGDTGSMFGHSPAPVAKAIRRQARRGLTAMLPTPDALAVGALLTERFGPFHWQMATTASDANRFALRVARAVTGRTKVLVFNGCYHGAVEETFVKLKDGKTSPKPGLVGQANDLTQHSVVVEFNDAAGLEQALAAGDIACVITEPVLTNTSMVLPEPGFLEDVRRLTRAHGTLLLIDETHTVSTGLGGYTRVHGLEPDIFVLGKPVAGGMPAAVWGLSAEVARRYGMFNAAREPGYSGIGTTLSGNPMQFAAMRACLSEVMTEKNYARMDRLAARLADGLSRVIAGRGLPWHVVRVGARVEFICAPGPLKTGAEAYASHRPHLEAAIHLGLLNRGCLIAPFHNMMLVSPVTTRKQVDALVKAFNRVTEHLTAGDLSVPKATA
ncbi:MAG: aspartate aminotransferase family protein [Rhizobiaceae bacterium]|jgi:glutamate-1-semialdehyde 2,1-aminomutase|nr:aspartate aminotransferase family protein [Rhizobiaceae bacterium]